MKYLTVLALIGGCCYYVNQDKNFEVEELDGEQVVKIIEKHNTNEVVKTEFKEEVNEVKTPTKSEKAVYRGVADEPNERSLDQEQIEMLENNFGIEYPEEQLAKLSDIGEKNNMAATIYNNLTQNYQELKNLCEEASSSQSTSDFVSAERKSIIFQLDLNTVVKFIEENQAE